MKKRLVVLTGAGMSAESGIQTFRGAGGLWNGVDVMEVASPEGWKANPEMVLEFYNQRRKNAQDVKPNGGHDVLAELEKDFDVQIITQNVDNLHERAGSTNVMHLHGELFKMRSTVDESLVYDMDGWELNIGDTCEKGSQLRPNIVWFGESVPLISDAFKLAETADIFVVIGTSLSVYPAASIINYVHQDVPKFIIDPEIPDVYQVSNLESIEMGAVKGSLELKERLKLLVD
jgi:NAD-dependent deacetylase